MKQLLITLATVIALYLAYVGVMLLISPKPPYEPSDP